MADKTSQTIFIAADPSTVMQVIADIGEWPVRPEVLMIEIYGQDIHDVVRSQACQTLEAAGYRFVERTGHTAVFHRRA